MTLRVRLTAGFRDEHLRAARLACVPLSDLQHRYLSSCSSKKCIVETGNPISIPYRRRRTAMCHRPPWSRPVPRRILRTSFAYPLGSWYSEPALPAGHHWTLHSCTSEPHEVTTQPPPVHPRSRAHPRRSPARRSPHTVVEGHRSGLPSRRSGAHQTPTNRDRGADRVLGHLPQLCR